MVGNNLSFSSMSENKVGIVVMNTKLLDIPVVWSNIFAHASLKFSSSKLWDASFFRPLIVRRRLLDRSSKHQ